MTGAPQIRRRENSELATPPSKAPPAKIRNTPPGCEQTDASDLGIRDWKRKGRRKKKVFLPQLIMTLPPLARIARSTTAAGIYSAAEMKEPFCHAQE